MSRPNGIHATRCASPATVIDDRSKTVFAPLGGADTHGDPRCHPGPLEQPGPGTTPSEVDERIGELDEQITDSGLRGTVLPARPRRHRSTRRRQHAAPLPRRPVSARTVGKTYTAVDGKTFRPSLFVTLTCTSYGRVGEDGAPTDPDAYDYARAARDALHFAALFDRFIQKVLPTWDQALGAIGARDDPRHVARFGTRFDAQGVLAGSRDASRCIGYLTKYLTKHLGDCHQAATDAQAARLARALRYEPCSPTCANWLRYGIQPKNARPGQRPGACKGKAHRREYLGYAGRRILVSRKWSGKTLADHRADRRTWLTSMLGIPATDPRRYTWEPVKPSDPDHMPNGQRLLHVVADRIQWQTALDLARRRAAEADLPATGEAA